MVGKLGVFMPPDADRPLIEAQLERILASRTFAKAPRQRKLLRFVASETLSGRGAELNERLIGAVVFEKDACYDNVRDASVRATASRLRQTLAKYYKTEGVSDPYLIEMPPNGYAVTITWRTMSDSPELDSCVDSLPARTTVTLLAESAASHKGVNSVPVMAPGRAGFRRGALAMAAVIVCLGLALYARHLPDRPVPLPEIGRASCRERV